MLIAGLEDRIPEGFWVWNREGMKREYGGKVDIYDEGQNRKFEGGEK